jgi:hypothetical protein
VWVGAREVAVGRSARGGATEFQARSGCCNCESEGWEAGARCACDRHSIGVRTMEIIIERTYRKSSEESFSRTLEPREMSSVNADAKWWFSRGD